MSACILIILGLMVPSLPPVQDEPTPPSYVRDIRPILQKNCFGCHQPAKASGDYVMNRFDHLVRGGESGETAIVAGDPTASYLLQMIEVVDGAASMPPDQPPLTENEIDLIRRWIATGAQDDSPAIQQLGYDKNNPPNYVGLPVITGLDYSPDGSLLAVSGFHEVLLWKSDGSTLIDRLIGISPRVESVAFSPDGQQLAVVGGAPGRFGEVQVWDVDRRELILSKTISTDTLYGASWSADGQKLAFGCSDNTVRVLQMPSGEQVLFNGAHDDWVLDTVFSTKADHLITVSRDRSMKLIEVPTQRFVDNITSITPGAVKGGLNAVDRHPDKDELLVGGADGTARIYRMLRNKARQIGDDYNLIRAFPPIKGRLFDVKYSPDGKRIAAASSDQGTGHVHVYDETNGDSLIQIQVVEGGIFVLDFSPDGKSIATAGFDGMIRLYGASDGKLTAEFGPASLTTHHKTGGPEK